MESQKKQRYKTVMVSIETHRLLYELQQAAQQIFGKKKISFDRLIRWLATSKVDFADIILAKEIME